MSSILALLAKLPSPLVDLVATIIDAIVHSPDPKASAERIAEEAARVKAFDELMKRAKPE